MSAPRSSDPPSAPDPRLILAVVCAAIFFGVLNASAVAVVLPAMGESFAVGPGPLASVMSVFLLTYGVAIPIYGRLADRHGARPLFVFGLASFAAGSLLCGVAPSLGTMIAARVLQGLGGAAFPGLGMTMVSRAVSPERRGVALGAIAATLGLGSAIGPVAGGVIAAFISWRALFLISALAAALVPFARRTLPLEDPDPGVTIDWTGAALLVSAIAGALMWLGQASARVGLDPRVLLDPLVLGLAALTLASASALVIHTRRTSAPFVPRALSSDLSVRRLVFMAALTSAAYLGAIVGLPLLLASVHGYPPLSIGLLLFPAAITTGIAGVLAGRLVDALGPRSPTTIGALGMLATLALLWQLAASSPVAVAVLAATLGVSYSLLNTPMSTALSRHVPDRVLAFALGLYSMAIFVGGSFGATSYVAVIEAGASASGLGFALGFAALGLAMIPTAALATQLPGRVAEPGSAPATTVLPDLDL